MSEENKKVELKEEELKKVTGGNDGGFNQNAINNIKNILNSIDVSDPSLDAGFLALFNSMKLCIESGAYVDAVSHAKDLIDVYGNESLFYQYQKILSHIIDILDIFHFELNIG